MTGVLCAGCAAEQRAGFPARGQSERAAGRASCAADRGCAGGPGMAPSGTPGPYPTMHVLHVLQSVTAPSWFESSNGGSWTSCSPALGAGSTLVPPIKTTCCSVWCARCAGFSGVFGNQQKVTADLCYRSYGSVNVVLNPSRFPATEFYPCQVVYMPCTAGLAESFVT